MINFVFFPVIIDTSDKQTTIEGVYKESDRTELLVKTEHTECGSCPLCALQLNLKHTVSFDI